MSARVARSAGFHGDRRGFAIAVALFAALVALGAFYISFSGLTSIGVLLGLGAFPWAVPVALDGAIMAATLLAIVRKAQKRRAALEWFIVYAASALSATVNFFIHDQLVDPLILAAVVAASAPMLLLLLSHSIIRTIIKSEPQSARAPREAKRTQTAAVEPAVASALAVATPALKPAPKRVSRPASAAVSLDALSPEVAAMVDEFRAVAHDPASSEGGAVSDRMSELLLALVDDHDVRAVDLSRIAGHADAARIRARLKKARDQQKNLVSV